MDKILVSHFPYNGSFSNGVINYTKSINSSSASSYKVIYKNEGESKEAFQNRLLRTLSFNHFPDDVLVEVAESQASALKIPRDFNVHVRMHCPFFLYKKIIKEEPDEQRFSEEVRGIYKAKAVSSPSYGMLELLKDELDISSIHVYKNPIDSDGINLNQVEKDIDVVFLLRFNKLKGSEYINPVLRMLPETYNVYLIGKQEEKFHLDSRIRCKVTILEHVEGQEKFNILKRSKVSLSMSKFENCSMVILESIGVGTPVVCWNVGGNAEIAPPSILSAIDYEDIFSYSEKIIEFVDRYDSNNYPTNNFFENTIESINKDFHDGSKFMEDNINNNSVYKGLSFASKHDSVPHIPYELRGYSWTNLDDRPIKYLGLTLTKNINEILSSYFKFNNQPIDIISKYNDRDIPIQAFDWTSKIQLLQKNIAEKNPDIIILENPGFTDEIKKNNFVKSLKKPVVFIKSLSERNAIVDRHGWDNDSFISNRRIKGFNDSNFIFEKSQNNILILGSKSSKKIIPLIQKIEAIVLKNNPDNIYISSNLDYSDDIVIPIDFNINTISEFEITDVILLDDDLCIEILGEPVNLYYCQSIKYLNNKNIGSSIFDGVIRQEIKMESERKILAELIEMKTIGKGKSMINLLDESLSVLNQSSFKKHYY